MRTAVIIGLLSGCVVAPFAVKFDWPWWVCMPAGVVAGFVANELWRRFPLR